LQVEFSAYVQAHCDQEGGELSGESIWQLFQERYLDESTLRYCGHAWRTPNVLDLTWQENGSLQQSEGCGNGLLSAAVAGLGAPLEIVSYEERSLGQGASAQAVAYLEVKRADQPGSFFGVGLDTDVATAALKALFSATIRAR
jgi:2-isopropylmalate synthase